jgi:polyphosphate kinase
MVIVASDPRLFLNRELSWLAFNERVLEEARCKDLPLFERLKFIGIVASNLDEFFMVRVAGLKQQLAGNVAETGADGMLPAEQLAAIGEHTHRMVAEQYRVWNEELVPALAESGIFLLTREQWNADQKAAARTHFNTNVFPALTPLAVDPGHPFPHLRNKSVNLAVMLGKDRRRRRRVPLADTTLAVVQVPGVLPRLVPLPSSTGAAYTMLGELIAAHMSDLFPGFIVKQIAPFRVTRNSDLNVDEEESEDLLSTIQAELRRRERGAAVRLEVHAAATDDLVDELRDALNVSAADVYRLPGPMQLQDVAAMAEADPRAELRVEAFTPVVPASLRDAETIREIVANHDVLLHHPYESFDPVVRFVSEAADDPNVLAIKQTLYRTSGDSPIVRALSRAAENGKQVAALVEIKARFDEANNIAWARRLEENGVHVVYGLLGLKTHCKAALVVRREGSGIRRYVHLGTGNYNPNTARQYTDLSLFTARPDIAEDVSALFNMLTGYCEPPVWKRLAVAPLGLQERILQLIERERARAAAGEPARIVAKINALVDPTVIEALYAAAGAGVDVDLLVRGICCLRPGVPGVSERIRVRSVVDRFLEHSRVMAFGVGERTEVFISSADWMPRNFQRRIEALIPIEDPGIRQRLLEEVLGAGLRDNVKARELRPDGTYVPVTPGEDGVQVRSQMLLLEAARKSAGADAGPSGPIPRPTGVPLPRVA